jgi:hypothetical protein
MHALLVVYPFLTKTVRLGLIVLAEIYCLMTTCVQRALGTR